MYLAKVTGALVSTTKHASLIQLSSEASFADISIPQRTRRY